MKVWVKICGVTSPEDARFAADCGADAIGVNFCPDSPRRCSEGRAREIVEASAGRVPVYGVFAGRSKAQIEMTMESTGIDAVQLHGGESAREAAGYRVPVLRAVAADSLATVAAALEQATDHRVLLDTPRARSAGGRFGGSGVRIEIDTLAGLDLSAAVIAGGLTPGNVGVVVRALEPFGVDVASGVERSAGSKDRDLVREFIENAKSA